MLCARVMRGISSMEKSVRPRPAASWMARGEPSGSANPITACPDRDAPSEDAA
jgi:hypothetical protein